MKSKHTPQQVDMGNRLLVVARACADVLLPVGEPHEVISAAITTLCMVAVDLGLDDSEERIVRHIRQGLIVFRAAAAKNGALQ